MLIQGKALQHWIDHFYGYGSWHARFWFVGYEESGGDVPEEVAEKLNYFYNVPASNTPTLCDIRELYRHVAFRVDGPRAEKFANLNDHRFGSHATLHGAWKNLVAFVHGYQNEKLPDLLAYQKNSFALPSARSEALIQLYPLPGHNHAWYYAWLDLPEFPFLKSRAIYQDYVYPNRMHNILQTSECGGHGGLALKECDFLVLFGHPVFEDLVLHGLNGRLHSGFEEDSTSPARGIVSTTVSLGRRSVKEGTRELDRGDLDAVQSRGVRLCMTVLA